MRARAHRALSQPRRAAGAGGTAGTGRCAAGPSAAAERGAGLARRRWRSRARRLRTRAASPDAGGEDGAAPGDGAEMDYRAFRARLVARHRAEELTVTEAEEAAGAAPGDAAEERARGADAAAGALDGANERWMYETPLLEQGAGFRIPATGRDGRLAAVRSGAHRLTCAARARLCPPAAAGNIILGGKEMKISFALRQQYFHKVRIGRARPAPRDETGAPATA